MATRQITLQEVLERKGSLNPVSQSLIEMATVMAEQFPDKEFPVKFFLTDDGEVRLNLSPEIREVVRRMYE